MIPFDGALGDGEVTGQRQDANEAKRALDPTSPNRSFADDMLGRQIGDLRRALDAAEPGEPGDFFNLAPSTCA